MFGGVCRWSMLISLQIIYLTASNPVARYNNVCVQPSGRINGFGDGNDETMISRLD